MNTEAIHLYAGDHAIEAADFVVNLVLPIDNADARRFDEHTNELEALFPSIVNIEMLQIELSNLPPNLTPQLPQLATPRQLTYFASDGRPEWVGFFGENRIVVSCRKYTKWETVWPKARDRINALLKCVDRYKQVHSMSYSVTDTFEAKKSDNALLASNIFRKNAFLPQNVLESTDPRWDFSQGWFDKADSQAHSDTLVRIDGRSSIKDEMAFVNISNLHSQRFGVGTTVDDIVSDSNGQSPPLESMYIRFHDRNKGLLRKLLVDQLLDRMRLLGES